MDESTNSCGITSCLSMANAEPPTVNVPVKPDGAALLRELDRMRVALASRLASRGLSGQKSDERLLVVSCFAPGFSMEHWRALVQDCTAQNTTSIAQWFALELDPAQHPQLAAICNGKNGVPLRQAVCPETGAMLPDFFVKNIAAELDKSRKTGNDLSLIILEIVDDRGKIDSPAKRRTPNPDEPALSQIFSGKISMQAMESMTPSVPEPDVKTLGQDLSGNEGAMLTQIGTQQPKNKMNPAVLKRLSLLAQTLRANARGCDVPARLAPDRMGLLMPGAGALRARAFTERLMQAFDENLRRTSGGTPVYIALRAGIACYDADEAIDQDILMREAATALTLAQPGGTRTFRKSGAIVAERKTQVQACEKQFLFFGTAEPSK